MDINFDPKLLVSQASAPRSLDDKKTSKDPEALRRACQDFEAVMLKAMLKSMRDTVPDDGLVEKSNGQEIFDDLMDQEVATQMARTEGVGIADMLFRQLQKASDQKASDQKASDQKASDQKASDQKQVISDE